MVDYALVNTKLGHCILRSTGERIDFKKIKFLIYLHDSVICIVMLKVVADIRGKAVVVQASFVKDELA